MAISYQWDVLTVNYKWDIFYFLLLIYLPKNINEFEQNKKK